METQARMVLRKANRTSGYIFAVVLLTLGMFAITGAAGWAWAGFVVMFIWGALSAFAAIVNSYVNNEEVKER